MDTLVGYTETLLTIESQVLTMIAEHNLDYAPQNGPVSPGRGKAPLLSGWDIKFLGMTPEIALTSVSGVFLCGGAIYFNWGDLSVFDIADVDFEKPRCADAPLLKNQHLLYCLPNLSHPRIL